MYQLNDDIRKEVAQNSGSLKNLYYTGGQLYKKFVKENDAKQSLN